MDELSSADWDDEDVSFGSTRSASPPTSPRRGDGEPHADAIRRAAEAGAYLVFLHPGLTNFLDFDQLPTDLLDAVETYNHNGAAVWPDQAEARYAVDALLARGCRLHVAVGDDAHFDHPWDRFARRSCRA